MHPSGNYVEELRLSMRNLRLSSRLNDLFSSVYRKRPCQFVSLFYVCERINWMSSIAATHMMITSLRQGLELRTTTSRIVKRFRGGLVVKAHRLLYHSTLGSRVIKKNMERMNWMSSLAATHARLDDHQPGAGCRLHPSGSYVCLTASTIF